MDLQTAYKSLKMSKSVPLDLRIPNINHNNNNNNNHYMSSVVIPHSYLPVDNCGSDKLNSLARDTTL